MSDEKRGGPVGWAPAPTVTQDTLADTIWSVGRLGEIPERRFMVLIKGGLLGNFKPADEHGWDIRDGQLAFVSDEGRITTDFRYVQMENGQITAFAGAMRLPGHETMFRELRRVGHPPHPLWPTSEDEERRASLLTCLPKPRRPNLVVLRAGEESLHPQWTDDLDDFDRSWDLCISYYGKDPARLIGACEYLAHQPHQTKLPALFDLFYPDSPLWGYEQVWLPDDDLMLARSDINRMFFLAQKHGLELSQPALKRAEGCYYSHEVTLQQLGSDIRPSDFVEVMCPIFTKRSLAICLGTFRDTVTGWGPDLIWPDLLGHPYHKIAMIDAVGIMHTRPVTGHCNPEAQVRASRECNAIIETYRS